LDSRKSVTFCKDSEVPIVGIVENMSGLECPHCHTHIDVFRKGGGEASALDMGVPFLGRIPLDPDVVTQSDAGEPFALFNSDTPTAEAYHRIANQVEAFCKKGASLLKVGRTATGLLKGGSQ
ncbi:MAG TPA: P-loop NTPase, partial [Nitrospira sp.]|nr:P-loop NTPase [Nitrospira sp.]